MHGQPPHELLSSRPDRDRHGVSWPPSGEFRSSGPLAAGLSQLELWHTSAAVPRALLLTAHPDDELLFAANLLLSTPWKWTLVCATHPSPARERGRLRATELLLESGVNVVGSKCLYLEDAYPHDPFTWCSQVAQNAEPYDVVFTHGLRGEYGNLHHVALHHVAHSLYRNVWDFYSPCDWKNEPQLLKTRVNVVAGSPLKTQLFSQAYPEEWLSLWSADPHLMEAQFTGLPEYFTSDVEPVVGEWPEWRWA